MKRKIMALSVAMLFASTTMAADVMVKNEGTLNVAPTFCELSYTSKVPTCTISVQATQGSKVTTLFYKRNPSSQYEDNFNIMSSDYSPGSRDFLTNPLFAEYEKEGVKQVRLIFKGKLTPDMASGEMHGRLLINIEKTGSSPMMFNLPVYFTTGKDQQPNLTSVAIGTTTTFDGQRLARPMTTMTIVNNGSGVLALNGISLKKKENKSDYQISEFTSINGNVLPQSRDTILISDEKLAQQLQAAKGSTIILSNKRKTEFFEVAIEK